MKTNRTVDRFVNMMELIANHSDGISLNEISEVLNIPKSSCFDILHTLIGRDMVEATGYDGKTYRVGVKSFLIGNRYMENRQVLEIARDRVRDLGDEFQKSVFIGEDSMGCVVYVYKYEPRNISVVATCTVGAKNQYYNTALGKCMLAFKDNFIELIDSYYEQGWIENKEVFISKIIEIRRCKYVYSDQEHQKSLFCIASPIFNHLGNVTMALSISGVYINSEDTLLETTKLKNVAEEISRQLGYVGEY